MSRRRAIVVDDQVVIVENLKLMLERCGVDVVGVAHAYDEAAGLLEAHPCDLAFIDLKLGEALSGADLARRAAERGIKVVVMTGFNRLPDGLEGAGLLTKPFSGDVVQVLLAGLQAPTPSSSRR